jgi:hypothetical protein
VAFALNFYLWNVPISILGPLGLVAVYGSAAFAAVPDCLTSVAGDIHRCNADGAQTRTSSVVGWGVLAGDRVRSDN